VDKHNPDHQARLKAALGLHAILFMRDPKKELDDARVYLYWMQLQDFDIEVVEAASFKLQGKLRKFPLPVDLREACQAVLERTTRPSYVNPRPPGEVAWCDEGCDDTGWVHVRKPLRELRDMREDDPDGDRLYDAVHRCSCWAINPVKKFREQQNVAGTIRHEEKQNNNWSPDRRGELVQFKGRGA